MRDVSIIGAGMTKFGKFPDATLRSLATEAIYEAISDADLTEADIQMVVHGNAMAGLLGGQEMIRGQVVTSGTGLVGLPLINVENACATSSTALHVGLVAVRSGLYDTVLVCGTEKMTGPSTRQILDAMQAGSDVERIAEYTRDLTGSDEPAESFYMEVYAKMTRDYMARSGATATDFADVAVKNSFHGSLNPKAQYRTPRTREEVLASRVVADPMTMLMCAPIADGAAALVIQADDRSTGTRTGAVRILASALGSGIPGGAPVVLEERTARVAYEQAGVGPEDLDVVEVHDAGSPNELMVYEEVGLCGPGEASALLASGATKLGGRVPVNVSGGLVSRGHPVGATGCAQIVELVTQLRGRAGDRQVKGARIGLAENAGGYTHPENAACAITILGTRE
jgi:acetyl-CoA acetyltransferase